MDTLSWWRDAAGRNPHRALAEFPSLPEEVRLLIPAAELVGLFRRAFQHDATEALRSVRFHPEETRLLLRPSLQQAWQETAAGDPSAALFLLSRFHAEERELLPLVELRSAWERVASQRPMDALRTLSSLPEALAQEISPTRVQALFREALGERDVSALVLLEDLAERYRATLEREDLQMAWQTARTSIHRFGEEHGSSWLWQKACVLPPEVLQAIGEPALESAWERYAAAHGFQPALTLLHQGKGPHAASAWLREAVAPAVARAWVAYSRKGAKDTLDLLRRLGEAAQRHLTAEEVRYAWRRRAKKALWEASAWLAQAPPSLQQGVLETEFSVLLEGDEPERLLGRLDPAALCAVPPGEVAAGFRHLLARQGARAAALLLERLPTAVLGDLRQEDLLPLLQSEEAEVRSLGIRQLHRMPRGAAPPALSPEETSLRKRPPR